MTDLLGMRADEALALLCERGVEHARVVEAKPPRGGHALGTLRVMRVIGGEILAARFPDEVQTD